MALYDLKRGYAILEKKMAGTYENSLCMSVLAGPDPPRLAGSARAGQLHRFVVIYFFESVGYRHLRSICNVYSLDSSFCLHSKCRILSGM